jgi:hypothetical protein
MQNIEGFDFFPLNFDGDGKAKAAAELKSFVERAAAVPATDAIFLAHGFRNDEAQATQLYTNFLKTFRAHLARPELASLNGRTFIVAGVYWPSKAFRESFGTDEGGVQSAGSDAEQLAEAKAQLADLKKQYADAGQKKKIDRAAKLLPKLEDDPAAQDEFVELVLSLLDDTELDATEGVDQIRAQAGSELLDKLSTPIVLPTSHDDDDDGGVAAVVAPPSSDDGETAGIGDVFGSVLGRVNQFLNLTTWYLMKERSGTVGAAGVADAVRALREKSSSTKIHLVGHSLGGRLMAGCAKSLASAPILHPESLTLLEAAFSHYGFSADAGHGKAGFFRDVIAKNVVSGPCVSTFSYQDTVVGKAYAIASRLAGDNVKAVGDKDDPFGGIGRNGAQKTTESSSARLHAPGTKYTFASKIVTCLDGSDGVIKDHGDVTNETVTYAFASAVAAT